MNSIKEQLVLLYCTVDDLLKSQVDGGQWRRSNNKPRFTDAEVLVIALMQHYFRTDTLKHTYLLVKANDRAAFRICWSKPTTEQLFGIGQRINNGLRGCIVWLDRLVK